MGVDRPVNGRAIEVAHPGRTTQRGKELPQESCEEQDDLVSPLGTNSFQRIHKKTSGYYNADGKIEIPREVRLLGPRNGP